MKYDRYFRNNGYSSDGFFLIKTKLENACLKRRKATTPDPDLKQYVKRILSNKKTIQFYPLKLSTLNTVKTIELYSFDLETRTSRIITLNLSFVKYFGSIKKLTFFQDELNQYAPIRVYKQDKFAGFIMPISTHP